MANTHRIDSLVLAMEEALEQKMDKVGPANLSTEERIVLAVVGLEREVNNGGYYQFFDNSSRQHVAEIVAALESIGCPDNAVLAAQAIAALNISPPYNESLLEATLENGGEDLEDKLSELDDKYYELEEPIAERLFDFVKANTNRISLR